MEEIEMKEKEEEQEWEVEEGQRDPLNLAPSDESGCDLIKYLCCTASWEV